jgi:CubicO group peptidase (beta-lactamase class C family)
MAPAAVPSTAVTPATTADPSPKPSSVSAEVEPVRIVSERTDELRLPPGEQMTPDAGTEAALRRHIESIERGSPGYDEMAPQLAAMVRAHGTWLERVAALGEVRTITFTGKGAQGANRFDVTTARGVSHWGINLDAERKATVLVFDEDPPATVPSEPEMLHELEQRLDRAVAADGFSGVVLLTRNGKTIFQAARGLADREHQRKIGMQTKFRIGSMNKMFTAVAVLQLREQGKLSLDDTLVKWLPDYPNSELANSVTLHQLLTHMGGTGDIFGPSFAAHRQELTSHQAYIDLYGNRALEFRPGTHFAYSNYGFVLLGRVIEKVSGESYYDYVQKHVYAPAKMAATGSEPETKAVADRSVGYWRGPESVKPNVDTLPPRGMAAGGGYSTAGDLLRFANALADHTLLNPESTRLLMTGKVAMGPQRRYAYGFIERDDHGIHVFGHGGGAPGMNGELAILPSSGHVLVVLSNLDPPAASEIADYVVERLPREEHASPPAVASTPRLAPPAPREPPTGPNLVDNGDFSAGDALWTTLEWPAFAGLRPIASRIDHGALCGIVKGGQNLLMTWPAPSTPPKAIELGIDKRYRFSFRASMTGPLAVRVVAKVGRQDEPYTPDVQAPIPVEAAPHVFALDFQPSHADTKAGLAFVLSAPRGDGQSEVCIDDVSVVGELR